MKLKRTFIGILSLVISAVILFCLLLSNNFKHVIRTELYFYNNQATFQMSEKEHNKVVINDIKKVEVKVEESFYWCYLNYDYYKDKNYFYEITPSNYQSIADGIWSTTIYLYSENGFIFLFDK